MVCLIESGVNVDPLVLLIVFAFICIALGAGGYALYQRVRLRTYRHLKEKILADANSNATALEEAARQKLEQQRNHVEEQQQQWWRGHEAKLQKEQERLRGREDRLETRLQTLEKKHQELEKQESSLLTAQKECAELQTKAQEAKGRYEQLLTQTALLTQEQAKEMLLQTTLQELEAELKARRLRIETQEREEANERATSILLTAMQRSALSVASEQTVTTLVLPQEEMKGRIIGREGRNVRLFERLTGVQVLLDETPGMLVLSSFDPMRRHLAKTAMSILLEDGRIHPTRIEEVVTRTEKELNKQIKRMGEEAALKAAVVPLHPQLHLLLGKLHFRMSYGQNVLQHSIEVAFFMGHLASELGASAALARRIGLLHDIGKALSHELEGSHDILGADQALEYGESAEVVNGIACHHGKVAPICLEAQLCAIADTLSAARIGARMEVLSSYVQRLQDLEELVKSFPGVYKVHALQAGREVHVFVDPEIVEEQALSHLAEEISTRIEKQLRYNGKIQVQIQRSTRAVAYALAR